MAQTKIQINQIKKILDISPVDTLTDIFLEYELIFKNKQSSRELIKGKILNNLFLLGVNILPIEYQIAVLDYVNHPDKMMRQEQIIIEFADKFPILVRKLSLNIENILELDDSVNTYPLYQDLMTYANKFETVYNL